ncbi:uncharacterized protein ACA1_037830 [Acanthamoeba castellanii str. Neff]|uniref:Uncharacterized protein n=1 Tax=Acanthamoeba castellanii (strain ATCC 30010 / Neff) TaxID=1257118 RepID=L8GN22_ACACF|nr:uncharacterized protein ACA1_037830 [Acanthamoeba castellanii str. Neff]ELR13611.1 hypothetical protein ACA1_037830 [Acanthamoeba castellanii str. Neff]
MKRVSHRAVHILALCLMAWVVFASGQNKFDVQDTFHVNVAGSFRQDTPSTCDYCDCSAANGCSWVDNSACPSLGFNEPDDNQQRWGECNPIWGVTCNCFGSSGVGFRGVSNVTIVSNPTDGVATKIGRMTHYNNPIAGFSPTQLRLTLSMDAPELSQPFSISYPLNFIETPNTVLANCDPVIQKTSVPCDDRFSFSDLVLTDTFTKDNIEYTLQIVGFVQDDSTDLTPIKGFVTRESNVTYADVYAKIVTACVQSECGPNEVFQAPPVCGCVCAVTDELCQAQHNGNPYWASVNETCGCQCTLTEADCPANSTYDAATCSCGCPLTDDQCNVVDKDFVVSPDPTLCGCVCSSMAVDACRSQGRFWNSSVESCDCYCFVTDQLCEDAYGSGYSADSDACGCVPGGGGLGGGEIAGIAVGAAAGALLLACLFGALAGLLAFLIRRGSMPGIYGVKIDDPGFEGASHSPLYHDPWKGNDNLLRG